VLHVAATTRSGARRSHLEGLRLWLDIVLPDAQVEAQDHFRRR
jgi:hypothetical protein